MLLRGMFTNIRPDAHDYVEYISADGGRTWHEDFFNHLTRMK